MVTGRGEEANSRFSCNESSLFEQSWKTGGLQEQNGASEKADVQIKKKENKDGVTNNAGMYARTITGVCN